MSEKNVRHSMTLTYSHEFNVGVNMSYNIDDMLLTRFYRVMLVSCLSVNCLVPICLQYFSLRPAVQYWFF